MRRNKVQAFIMVREGDRWRCAAYQNTKQKRLFIRVNELSEPRSKAASS